ncbi:MAG: RNA polymerase sigma factor [Bradymonadaceae bacterium]
MDDDSDCLDRLLAGDEEAFSELIDDYHAEMIRVAEAFVDDRSTAEESVQETWTAVIEGLDDFEGRSSLKTWIFSILTNQARKRGEKEAREPNWSELSEEPLDREVTEDANRFNAEGRWSKPPVPWSVDPEEKTLRREMLSVVDEAIDDLPRRQRVVVTMRDVEGWSSDEVCDVLDISNGNQRVLLHRGRKKLRRVLEEVFGDVGGAT